jgi:glycosyltransferase involved in cell wall biosynthesis
MNIIYKLESQRLRKYEAIIANTFQHCILVSEKETADFTKLVCTGSNITPVMNGVDTDRFSYEPVNYNRECLVFTGAMDYYANVEAVLYFVNCILPLIKEVVPSVKFYVVGSNPTPKILDLPSEFPNVTVTGYVDSVKSYVVNSAVFVAPMRIARGVQNKILEAMAMGVPVVTTSLGFEGLACLPGRDLYVEDQPERFASQVLRLMHDDELRNTTAAHALKTIKENYNWSDNLEKLTQVIDLATAR